MTNQGKLLTKLSTRYVKVFNSLPWLVNRTYGLKIIKCLNIFLSQCRNIVCKNIWCISHKSRGRGSSDNTCVTKIVIQLQQRKRSIKMSAVQLVRKIQFLFQRQNTTGIYCSKENQEPQQITEQVRKHMFWVAILAFLKEKNQSFFPF
jgi:hypothetical protein